MMSNIDEKNILYQDNHLLIYNKSVGEIVQGDKTGDICLLDKLKAYIKLKYNKPGNVYLGLIHRLDRPTSGLVAFAKSSKALSRMNAMFQKREIEKRYFAIVEGQVNTSTPQKLVHFLAKNEKQNKSYVVDSEKNAAKQAILTYELLSKGDKYSLLSIALATGRHHQIRAQLAHIGHIIKGDLKYGAKRSNSDKGISLHAGELRFIHPVTQNPIEVKAPFPNTDIYHKLMPATAK